MNSQKKGKLIAVIGFVILVVGIMLGNLISASSSESQGGLVSDVLAGEHILNILLPLFGVALVVVGMKIQKRS